MKINREEFLSLQKRWYRILSRSGFWDIEVMKGSELVLKQTSSCKVDKFTRSGREEYYRVMSARINSDDTVFRTATDKFILTKYIEGHKIKDIVEDLLELGCPRHRHSIRFIIRRYEVEWGVKEYEPKQLNVKAYG